MDGTSILLAEDDQYLADSLSLWLREQGFEVSTVESLAEANHALRQQTFDLLLCDLRLPDGDGFSLIELCKTKYRDCKVIVMTGYATPDTAMDAIRAGAFDVLTKPVIDEELLVAIERAVSQHRMEAENQRLKQQLDNKFGAGSILSQDYRMLKLFDIIENVADARASVLITGENGTGKSMIARAVHRASNRRDAPFVEVACGALPDNLLESELFGHVAGAFTGATSNRTGKFKLADGGTLFLDEIGTASPAMQVKLLRVLQELQFEPLGGTKTETVDVRVILATNEDLTEAVRKGTFRQDLYYRVNVIHIELPPLRRRKGDIPILVQHFIQKNAEALRRTIAGFDREALQTLQEYAWPGNVRELENVVERAVLLSRNEVLTLHDLPPEMLQSSSKGSNVAGNPPPGQTSWHPMESGQALSLREALEEPERQIILETLKMFQWNRVATAEALEINRTTLYKKMKRLGLDDPRLQYMH